MAVDLVGIQSAEHLNRIFQLTNHDFAVNQAVAILNRTGHARFRRGPSSSSSSDPQTSSSANSKSEPPRETPAVNSKECINKSITTLSATSTSSSLTSSIAGDESVHNGKKVSSSSIITPAPTFSAKKPPLPSSHRKRSSDRISLEGSAYRDYSVSRGSHGCHCCKRRKMHVKIKKIPVIGSKVASIPADEYSWKKQGEKRIEGSPYPRVYYKCSTASGCPARKRVEMARGESKVLILTYVGEHRHSHRPVPVPTALTSPVIHTIESK